MYCSKCGAYNDNSVTTCSSCGVSVNQDINGYTTQEPTYQGSTNSQGNTQFNQQQYQDPFQQQYQQPFQQPQQPFQQPNNPYSYQQPMETKTNGFAIAGFVLSIVSLFFAKYLVVTIVALVLSIIGMKQCKRDGTKGRGLGIAGLVISIVIIAFYIFIIAIAAAFLSEFTSMFLY